jgi:hypothetical protein
MTTLDQHTTAIAEQATAIDQHTAAIKQLQAGNQELQMAFKRLEDSIQPLVADKSKLLVREAMCHLEWYACLEAAPSREKAKKQWFNFEQFKLAGLDLPSWVTPEVFGLLRYLKQEGSSVAHCMPFTKADLVEAIKEDDDSYEEKALKALMIAQLENYYKTAGMGFGASPKK